MAKKRKLAYESTATLNVTIPTVRTDDNQFWDVSGQYLSMISGADPNTNMIMFEQQESNLLADEITLFLQTAERVLVVMGPPGVGKSLTALTTAVVRFTAAAVTPMLYFFVPTQATEATYVVGYVMSYYDGVSVQVDKVNVLLSDVLTCCEEYNADLVVFDNITHSTYGIVAGLEARTRGSNKKFIAVSSMQVRVPMNLESIRRYYVRNGWSLADYEAALRHDAFYQSVFPRLRCFEDQTININNTIDERKEIARSKFTIAGHSARWFFMDTIKLLQDIEVNVRHITSAFAERMKESDTSREAENQLLSRVNNVTVLVSDCVARMVLQIVGTRLLKSALTLLQFHPNPGADGVLMELDFMTRLGKETDATQIHLPLALRNSGTDPLIHSGSKIYQYVRPTVANRNSPLLFSQVSPDADTLRDNDWFVPLIFNNSGFDFVQYGRTAVGHVLRFFQVTRASTHSFNRTHYNAFYTMFHAKYPGLKPVSEVYFVVEIRHRDTFAVDTPSGTLTGFNDGEEHIVSFARVTAE